MWKVLVVAVLGFMAFAVASAMEVPPLVTALQKVGCSDAAIAYAKVDGKLVLAVSATQCVDEGGALMTAGQALSEIAEVTWATPTHHVDAVHATVYHVAERPAFTHTTSQVFDRARLQARFGARSPELDHDVTVRELFDSVSWVGLLAGLIVALVLPIYLGVNSAQMGIVVIPVRW